MREPPTLDLLLMDDACQSVGPVLWSLEVGPERAVPFCSDSRLCSEARSYELESYSRTSEESNHHQ